jgi:hypothetical protein
MRLQTTCFRAATVRERFGLAFFAAFFCLAALASAQDAHEIVKRACEFDQKNADLVRNYTFLQRQVDSDLDGAGKPKRQDIRTWDVTILDGSPYHRLVARNDQPLSPAEQKQEEDKLRFSNEERRKETPEQRSARIADWDRKRQKQREPLKDLPDAFNFRLVGEETLNGGQAYVIDATPKPGYKPRSTATAFFPKVKARFWIDKAGYQWVKVDMETIDTISFGGFLLRLAKGGHLMIEQTHVRDEVWMPSRVKLEASARVVFVKGVRKSLDMTFSDYKKFQSDSRVISDRDK